MLRSAFWLLFAFAAAVVFALLLRGNHGSVSIFWPPYRIDLASNMVLVLAIIGFFILHLLLIGLARLLGLPKRLRAYRERRRLRRANKAVQGASVAWFEGRFEKAERLAAIAMDESSTAPTAALIAARSAHRLGAAGRRDDWLRQVIRADPAQSAAVLAEAEFALDDRHPERALAAVARLRAGGVESRLALATSIAAWRQFGRWEQVLEAVRAQKGKSGRLDPLEADVLRLQAYEGLLAPHREDATAILECWRGLRSDERRRRDLAVPTVLALLRVGEAEEARKILIPILDREYDDTLVEAYGAMEAIPGRTRLEQLERWRNRYGDRPRLLEMLGRVCAAECLWGKAETYLLQSVAAADSVSARVALAQLYDEIDRRADASVQFQAAARLALGERPGLALQLDPVRAQGRVAIGGARPVSPADRGAAAVASLPGAAAAAGALATEDEDTELAASLPHPIPTPEGAVIDAVPVVAEAGEPGSAAVQGNGQGGQGDGGPGAPDAGAGSTPGAGSGPGPDAGKGSGNGESSAGAAAGDVPAADAPGSTTARASTDANAPAAGDEVPGLPPSTGVALGRSTRRSTSDDS